MICCTYHTVLFCMLAGSLRLIATVVALMWSMLQARWNPEILCYGSISANLSGQLSMTASAAEVPYFGGLDLDESSILLRSVWSHPSHILLGLCSGMESGGSLRRIESAGLM